MRPLELIVEGFTSFRTRQVLDFTSLDLFAITGATGAGKTSLLDAITFALYDKVANKPNSSKELVSQGATQLKVEFRFEIRQSEYRVIRTWRNRGKTDEKKFLLDKLVDGAWERGDRTEKIEEIIGMDFDTFTRVIILPQGQFDEFLKGEASKRREILRQLAGFQIFEQMRKEASDRTSRHKSEREGLEKVLEGMQVPTLEEVNAQQQDLEALETTIPELEYRNKQSCKLLESEESLFAQLQQQIQITDKLSALQQSAAEIHSLEMQLHHAQLANSIAGTWTILQSSRQRLKAAIAALAESNQNLNQSHTQLELQQQALNQIREHDFTAQEQIAIQESRLALAESLYKQERQFTAELDRADQNFQERSLVYKDATKAHQEAEIEWQATSQKLEEIELAIASSGNNSERLESLRQVAEPLAQWQRQKDSLAKQQQKLAQLQREKNELAQQLAKKQQSFTQLEDNFNKANSDLIKAEASNLQALQSNHVNALRAELHDGDNCPVCNNTYSIDGLAKLEDLELISTVELKKQKNILEKQLGQLREDRVKLEANLVNSQHQWDERSQEVLELESQVQNLYSQISQVLRSDWTAEATLGDRQELEQQEQEYQRLTTTKSELISKAWNQETKLMASRDNLKLAEVELQKAIQEQSQRQSQLQETAQQLQAITLGKSYEALRQEIADQKVELRDRLQKAEAAYQQARENFIKSEATAVKAQQDHVLALEEDSRNQENWQSELDKLNFTEAQFLSAQTGRSQIETWQQQVEDYQRQVQDLSTRLEVVREAIADRHTDEQSIQALRETILLLEQELQQKSENRASIKAWLEQADQQRQASQAIAERRDVLQSQEQTYHTLAQDLRSDKFQEYILDSLQQELANRASVLLKQLSEDRYLLQIENGDYWVSDNWNGGEKRRVRTLSGGETFAASLSMALALSERLAMGVELGSLFLDEGFGTLDSETLESVTQILESLRQKDRLIGVITHIQALADRLPTQIHVRKSPSGSELIMI
ncbi:MAG: chromosome segregation protein SMC [Pseudanabaena sp.]|nr:MAG: chromosome segregation protein SMC [Pseudanabaena sp.]